MRNQERTRGSIKGSKKCDVEFCSYGKKYRGVSDNFSIDGLLIVTDDLLALQTGVSITVDLPDGSTSNIKGRAGRVHKVSGSSAGAEQTFKGVMGEEVIERDSNYLKFFMSLLSGT